MFAWLGWSQDGWASGRPHAEQNDPGIRAVSPVVLLDIEMIHKGT